jgi:hypothetical protein
MKNLHLIPTEIFKHFSERGYKHHTQHSIDQLDELSLDNPDIITEFAHIREWLRINHGIWIPINPKREKINGVNEMWYDAEVWKLEPSEIRGYGWSELAETFKTPQEAYSAAFDYILNSLLI